MKRAVIVSNGTINDYEYIKSFISDDDVIICADGAVSHLKKMGLYPHVWIGDNDSCNMTEGEFSKWSKNSEVIKLNPVKDATDTESACDYVINHGFDSLIIIGALGSRFDHSFANVMLLVKLEKAGVKAKIINEKNIIYVAEKFNTIENGDFENVSLVPVTPVLEDVTIKGLYYELNNATLDMYSSLGVSNKLVSPKGEITIKKGQALIILSKD